MLKALNTVWFYQPKAIHYLIHNYRSYKNEVYNTKKKEILSASPNHLNLYNKSSECLNQKRRF